jgi:type II secretory pathway predicted ATPase ExeA
MTLLRKIPCTIVTGFLGAGKTTLVRHAVEVVGHGAADAAVGQFHHRVLVAAGHAAARQQRAVDPCTIVTGFLGAGKTTLVRHAVEHNDGRRLAIIVSLLSAGTKSSATVQQMQPLASSTTASSSQPGTPPSRRSTS